MSFGFDRRGAVADLCCVQILVISQSFAHTLTRVVIDLHCTWCQVRSTAGLDSGRSTSRFDASLIHIKRGYFFDSASQ
jgi:hypothetical protein